MAWNDASVPMNVEVVENPEKVPEYPPDGDILIFTDGSCWPNPGPAGVGIVMRYQNHEKEVTTPLGNGTNNVAEVRAILDALRLVKRPDLRVHLYTDSQ
jgi:ribonuclease HI